MNGTTVTSVHPDARADAFLAQMWQALGGHGESALPDIAFRGRGALTSCFAMNDLGAAAVAAAAAAVSRLAAASESQRPPARLTVDRELTSGWFHRPSIGVRPTESRSPFHPMSTDFATADGRWLRFQANYPHLRAAALRVLDVAEDRPDLGEAIARVVADHDGDELEAAVLAGGGAAAVSRTLHQWAAHPQGRAVRAERLVEIEHTAAGTVDGWRPLAERPLAGVRVLDVTRVLAGPVATRFLAAYGAEVLRIDPPGYDEPHGIGNGDLTLGKRCAHLRLDTPEGRQRFLELLSGAHVLVHGLRPGALDRLGLGAPLRSAARPGLVEVTLDAYGWTGPWAGRRGFDTLVQCSTGMAVAGGAWAGTTRPHRWPVSILDHATGYLMAAAAVRGLSRLLTAGTGSISRLSLARTAELLVSAGISASTTDDDALPVRGPWQDSLASGPGGPVRRLAWPVHIEGTPAGFDRPGDPLGTAVATWIG